jgi:SAM-dependent methyltransferase
MSLFQAIKRRIGGPAIAGVRLALKEAQDCFSGLDSPGLRGKPPYQVPSPMQSAGWVLPPKHRRLEAVEYWIDDNLIALARLRIPRPDLVASFPADSRAAWAGFDVECALDRWAGQEVELRVLARLDSGVEPLANIPILVTSTWPEPVRRERSYDLASLLSCPLCGGCRLREGEQKLQCQDCDAAFEVRGRTPVFAIKTKPATSRRNEPGQTHPYSNDCKAILQEMAAGVVLDLGAGNGDPNQHVPNVLYHDIIQYPYTDVVSALPRLPYKDSSFDAVISQAVFEHLSRPWEVADELYRVLKPGGRLHVDTAFMQPFHADPCHFFNMTIQGVRQIFRRFEERSAGVKGYQSPAWALRMQCDIMLNHLRPGKWRDRIKEMRMLLDCEDFDLELDELGRTYLAAGVYFDGYKPAN